MHELVAEVDGKPGPKVIDFGIAKATRGRLTEQHAARLRELTERHGRLPGA